MYHTFYTRFQQAVTVFEMVAATIMGILFFFVMCVLA